MKQECDVRPSRMQWVWSNTLSPFDVFRNIWTLLRPLACSLQVEMWSDVRDCPGQSWRVTVLEHSFSWDCLVHFLVLRRRCPALHYVVRSDVWPYKQSHTRHWDGLDWSQRCRHFHWTAYVHTTRIRWWLFLLFKLIRFFAIISA